MNTEEKIKFLERIIPISQFYTKSYLSEKTSKLIWMFFVLNSCYILLFANTITIKELTIYVFSIEIDPNQLMLLITISAFAISIKALMNVSGDIKNNRHEADLNTYKFIKLKQEISNAREELNNEATHYFTLMNERRQKLEKAYIKCLHEKSNFDISKSLSPQDNEIRKFCNARLNFIELALQRTHRYDDNRIEEIKNQTMMLSSKINSLSVVVKSHKKQWWATTLINFTPPALTITYTFCMHFGNDIINFIKMIKLIATN